MDKHFCSKTTERKTSDQLTIQVRKVIRAATWTMIPENVSSTEESEPSGIR